LHVAPPNDRRCFILAETHVSCAVHVQDHLLLNNSSASEFSGVCLGAAPSATVVTVTCIMRQVECKQKDEKLVCKDMEIETLNRQIADLRDFVVTSGNAFGSAASLGGESESYYTSTLRRTRT
jgi:hypothetical protein